MNLRERIADFISGGEYRRAVLIAGEAAILMVDRHNLAAKRGRALEKIAALETPNASHTVRKMAVIAREAAQ